MKRSVRCQMCIRLIMKAIDDELETLDEVNGMSQKASDLLEVLFFLTSDEFAEVEK